MSEHVLAARSDEYLKSDEPDRELRRARVLERINTMAELCSIEELESWAAFGEATVGKRS